MNSKQIFAVHVVGCKVNQVEASLLSAQLESAGWRLSSNEDQPDLVLVHTCTVTQRADRDSKKYITQAKKQYPDAAIAVSGCLAEMESEKLAKLPGVVAVIDQAHRSQAAQIISQAIKLFHRTRQVTDQAWQDPVARGFFQTGPLSPMPGKSRAMIKIEDGCDGSCTYCRVRLARGKPVSRPLVDIKNEVEQYVKNGFQEIVITGVNIGCWQPGLAQLIPELIKIPGTYRLRLSSVEPQHLSDDLIQALKTAGDKICPHLHLSLQSGDDGILKAMRRTYNTAQFKKKVAKLKQARSDFVITGDVIVGFPGETKQAFKNSCKLVRECNMIRLHVFPFSARPGTQAANMPGRIISREITARAKELRTIGKALAVQYRKSRLNTRTTVLLEQKTDNNTWTGTTETYAKAKIKIRGQAGQLVTGTIIRISGETLIVNP
ncbi:tRNA (N(6)-L-threonylcarbamoyladenosine(37)-C(2))-methylthiotransferase MtaB [bacterium]|nr:tRNA (N(6)-L-threonylcarbamoyladenosine(37)-C(2))-methylthiotransferase MtaB [bacterium]